MSYRTNRLTIVFNHQIPSDQGEPLCKAIEKHNHKKIISILDEHNIPLFLKFPKYLIRKHLDSIDEKGDITLFKMIYKYVGNGNKVIHKILDTYAELLNSSNPDDPAYAVNVTYGGLCGDKESKFIILKELKEWIAESKGPYVRGNHMAYSYSQYLKRISSKKNA